jgi:imidazolonepropionase
MARASRTAPPKRKKKKATTKRRSPERGSVLIENIGELLTCAGPPESPIGLVNHAAVLIKNGRVVFAGPSDEIGIVGRDIARIDAGGALVTPGLIDPHAHTIFAGSRALEFDLRAKGRTYLEIQHAGGGIQATVTATREASDEELFASTCARLDRFLRQGVTVVESKTGYDLSPDGELRLLKLLAMVKKRHVIDLSPTLLAHVPPPDRDRELFVETWCQKTIPAAAKLGAEAVDVYCDEGAFTLDETRAILEAGQAAGLALRAHAEQFTHTGAAVLAAELGARSVEHLEELAPDAPSKLAKAGTVCNLLPGAALTLKLKWPDARRLRAVGCRVALGTDCNPGSSLTESLPLMMSLACMQMGLSCAEAWLAVTREAAHSTLRDDAGRLATGARGDLVIWDSGDHREIAQHFGVPLARTVIIRGETAYSSRS